MNTHVTPAGPTRTRMACMAVTVGAAFLLTTAVGAPAHAMLAPFDPAAVTGIAHSAGRATPYCFMGHSTWPGAAEPQAACTA